LEPELQHKDVLNLNNEVVKMRKEVKRVKALIIRKLTRQIGALKKKKGKEAEVERNQKRAMRLLEEVHCMKKLRPDQVTKTALQKNLNFEQVCKNPNSTISDRAVARIATHPQFNKKIECLKAAVKTFKEERSKGGKQGGQAKVQRQPEKATPPFPDAKVEKESPKIQEGDAVEPEGGADSEKGVGVSRITEDRAAASAGKEIKKAAREVHGKESTCVKPTPVKKDPVKHEAQSESEENNSDLRSVPTVLDIKTDEEESDVESSDNEAKEYFDDSTEERFHKQSSQSEESDDDDFFVGKVSKFKKKKKKQTDVDRGQEGKKELSGNVRARDKLQHELDELESRLKSKAATLQSVFCSSLARTKAGRGSDRRQGGGKSTDQGKPGVASRVKGDCLDKQPNRSQEKGASNSRGGGVFDLQPPLHPSWEASIKRKEQQGQILAFQGKKIKFDDDDD
uniref:Serum response factor-binding protein 1 n=1 Tax=Kryptolebias marmoratus TaxID=37003 RepID=A0A3Q2ZFL5_KRYMA